MRVQHKYGARVVWVDNIRFQSQKEARRFTELRMLAAAQHIEGLKMQVIFQFWSAGIEIGRWIVDFTYVEKGVKVAEDTTGYMTKKKTRLTNLFREQYPDWELRIT